MPHPVVGKLERTPEFGLRATTQTSKNQEVELECAPEFGLRATQTSKNQESAKRLRAD